MIRLRSKLAGYQEQLYMVFILSMVALISAGFNSEDKIYLIVFFVASFFLLLKMAVTDFTMLEFLWMVVITLLLGINFLRNGEKTLIMTVMGIFGAKNVSIENVFRYSLWLKLFLTVGAIFCAATGIIENEIFRIPKNGQYLSLYSFGYQHPNAAFANIFLIFIFAVLVWQDKIKWYMYVGFTLVLLGTYKILMCRTGLVVWAALLIIISGYKISCKLHWDKKYLTLLLAGPVILALLTFIIPLIGMQNGVFLKKIDYYLTGRIHHLILAWDNLGFSILGNAPREPFDSSYFHLVYNYGWLSAVICFLAYLRTMWYCVKNMKPYETIVLCTMSIYAFMEHWPLSIGWNLPLLFTAAVLFQAENSASIRNFLHTSIHASNGDKNIM